MSRLAHYRLRSPLNPGLSVRGSQEDTLSDVVDACLQVPEAQADLRPPSLPTL